MFGCGEERVRFAQRDIRVALSQCHAQRQQLDGLGSVEDVAQTGFLAAALRASAVLVVGRHGVHGVESCVGRVQHS